LADIGAQATQEARPAFGRRPAARPPRPAWKRIGTGLAVAAAMTAAGLAGWQAGLTGAARPSAAAARHPAPQALPMVLVSSASLAGQRAGAVLTNLRGLGLRPRLAWVATSAQPPGTVLSVQPGGALPPGTVVTVTVAAQPAQHGGQAGDGGDGNGGNDGGSGGTDGGSGGTDGGGGNGGTDGGGGNGG
jgi:serine/threonine-protein kinase